MGAHRSRDGSWSECSDAERCTLVFHVELSADDAALLPEHVMLHILNVIDPPSEIETDGTQVWYEDDYWGTKHRDYDLPAIVYADGGMEWWQQGEPHRDYDRPALVSSTGNRQWWQHNQLHRDGGKPATIDADGTMRWYNKGAYVSTVIDLSRKL